MVIWKSRSDNFWVIGTAGRSLAGYCLGVCETALNMHFDLSFNPATDNHTQYSDISIHGPTGSWRIQLDLSDTSYWLERDLVSH